MSENKRYWVKFSNGEVVTGIKDGDKFPKGEKGKIVVNWGVIHCI